jgi:hypothetical protein
LFYEHYNIENGRFEVANFDEKCKKSHFLAAKSVVFYYIYLYGEIFIQIAAGMEKFREEEAARSLRGKADREKLFAQRIRRK